MLKKMFISSISSVFLIFTSGYSAMAEVDFTRSINLAGKERMLSQKLAKETMFIAHNTNKEQNLANLKATRYEFNKILNGLQKGDNSLGLTAIDDTEIQNQLSHVKQLWEEYNTTISSVIETKSVTPQHVASISYLSVPVLQEMNKAVKMIEQKAGSGNTSAALATTINIAGRQRMLSQKMTKEFLLIAYGKDIENNKQSLNQSISLFENSLNSLINGNSATNIQKAPNPEIEQQLQKVLTIWNNFKPIISSDANKENILNASKRNLMLLEEMNKAVKMYENIN